MADIDNNDDSLWDEGPSDNPYGNPYDPDEEEDALIEGPDFWKEGEDEDSLLFAEGDDLIDDPSFFDENQPRFGDSPEEVRRKIEESTKRAAERARQNFPIILANFFEAVDEFYAAAEDFQERMGAVTRFIQTISDFAYRVSGLGLFSGYVLSYEDGKALRGTFARLAKTLFQDPAVYPDYKKDPFASSIQYLLNASFTEEEREEFYANFRQARHFLGLIPWRAPVLFIYSPNFPMETIECEAADGIGEKKIRDDIAIRLPEIGQLREKMEARGVRVFLYRPLSREGEKGGEFLLYKELIGDDSCLNIGQKFGLFDIAASGSGDFSKTPPETTRLSQLFQYASHEKGLAAPVMIFADADNLPSERDLEVFLENIHPQEPSFLVDWPNKNDLDRRVNFVVTAATSLDLIRALPCTKEGNPTAQGIKNILEVIGGWPDENDKNDENRGEEEKESAPISPTATTKPATLTVAPNWLRAAYGDDWYHQRAKG